MKTRNDAIAEFDDVDMDALDRSMVAARAGGGGRSDQLDMMLEDRDWIEVAKFASYSAQCESLELAPWENPPCWGNPDGESVEDVLLGRMIEVGLSRYEPSAAKLAPLRRKTAAKN